MECMIRFDDAMSLTQGYILPVFKIAGILERVTKATGRYGWKGIFMATEASWTEPDCIYLTAGTAVGGTALNAFDNALQDAGIADFNLIEISSVVPAGTPIRKLPPDITLPGNGRFLPTVYGDIRSNDTGKAIAAAIGIGKPTDSQAAGVIFEYSGHGGEDAAVAEVREMVEEGMEKRQIESYDVETTAASTVVAPEFSAVVTAAIFCVADVLNIVQAVRQNE